MGNLMLVKVLESPCDWTEPGLGIPLTEWAIFADDIADVAIGSKVHDDVDLGARSKELFDVNAVWMLQVVHYLQFTLQVIVQLLTVGVLNVDHLDGVVTAVLDALVHICLTARVDALETAVASMT